MGFPRSQKPSNFGGTPIYRTPHIEIWLLIYLRSWVCYMAVFCLMNDFAPVCCRALAALFVDAKHIMSAMLVGCAVFWQFSLSKAMFLGARTCRAKERSHAEFCLITPHHHTIICVRTSGFSRHPTDDCFCWSPFALLLTRVVLDRFVPLVGLLHTCVCSTLFFLITLLYSFCSFFSTFVYSSLLTFLYFVSSLHFSLRFSSLHI